MTIGPIISNIDIQAAVRSLFSAKVGLLPVPPLPDDRPTLTSMYLNEVGDQQDRGDLPDFRSITTANDYDKWPEDQLPAAIVISPGLAEEPARHGKDWKARWALGIGVVVSAGTRSDTLDLVGAYAAAVRAMILQNSSLGGFADGTYWIGERYDEIDTDDSRTLAGGQVLFVVDVAAVVDSQGGLVAPIEIGEVGISVDAL